MSNLSDMTRLYIRVNAIEQKQLCASIDISESTLTRFLQGNDMDMRNFGKLIKWLTSKSDVPGSVGKEATE